MKVEYLACRVLKELKIIMKEPCDFRKRNVTILVDPVNMFFFCHLGQSVALQNFTLWYGMVIWWLCWHRTILIRNITQKPYSQGRRALSNHACAHSVISMWHVVCLQHLARACSEQSRSTTVLPINHVIQMPQCLSGFVNRDYSFMRSNKGWWQCLVPTSTTRFAGDVGYRMAKM